MAKWFSFIIQKQGDMPQYTKMFSSVEAAQHAAASLVKSGTPKDHLYLVSWEDSERIVNLEGNLADLTDDQLRQLGEFRLGESGLGDGRLG